MSSAAQAIVRMRRVEDLIDLDTLFAKRAEEALASNKLSKEDQVALQKTLTALRENVFSEVSKHVVAMPDAGM
jgi:hypothetical protein